MKHSNLPLHEILAKYDWISTFTHPPNITSLLHHNVVPSSLQTTQLKVSLESLKSPLAEIDGDLDLLCNAVVSLEAHRSCLQSLESDCATALSPIRCVPPEIMIEILHRSWKDNRFRGMLTGSRLDGFNVFAVQEGPWHLGQMCSSWRNVIKTHCPELWASMTITLPSPYKPKARLTADAVEMLCVILERSCNHPLNFDFSCDCSVPRSEAEEGLSQLMKHWFDLMMAHSRWWRAVRLMMHASYLPRLSLVHGKVDLLREMYLDCADEADEPPSRDICTFEIAPKLEILHLNGMHERAYIGFPASNLVSFSDARPFSGDWLTPTYLAVVKLAPKLLSFSYNDCGVQSLNVHPVPNPPSLVMGPSMENLLATSPSFLCSLVLPSLKEVTLTTLYEFDMEEQVITCPVGTLGALHQMLLQSQCSLTQLRLVNADLDNNLVNVIHLMPRLWEFAIEFYEWVPEITDDYGTIMQSLVAQLSKVEMVDGSLQHSVVPFLQSLTVEMHTIRYAHVSFINSAFVDMVALRVCRPHIIAHLTNLDLWVMGRGWSYDLDQKAEETLKDLEREGLTLDFGLHDGDPASGPESDSD
ncbi:hypothetical protein EDD18DRAFT_1116176 [Armillaria luteobubalina]|uniref:F-box domain-containing protein n=1 Tax=Armillaria luteobubalina TaxID=153913 RepID=A0AA39UDU8_9AGAR|nr:hypothetical protein EDD18DRAFT_1116176 [Armillaria luteobubalina]